MISVKCKHWRRKDLRYDWLSRTRNEGSARMYETADRHAPSRKARILHQSLCRLRLCGHFDQTVILFSALCNNTIMHHHSSSNRHSRFCSSHISCATFTPTWRILRLLINLEDSSLASMIRFAKKFPPKGYKPQHMGVK